MVFHFSIHAVLIKEIYHCGQLYSQTHKYIAIEKSFLSRNGSSFSSSALDQTVYKKSLQK